jgi:hypothetical protein
MKIDALVLTFLLNALWQVPPPPPPIPMKRES